MFVDLVVLISLVFHDSTRIVQFEIDQVLPSAAVHLAQIALYHGIPLIVGLLHFGIDE